MVMSRLGLSFCTLDLPYCAKGHALAEGMAEKMRTSVSAARMDCACVGGFTSLGRVFQSYQDLER